MLLKGYINHDYAHHSYILKKTKFMKKIIKGYLNLALITFTEETLNRKLPFLYSQFLTDVIFYIKSFYVNVQFLYPLKK